MKTIKPCNTIFIFSDQHSREKIGCYGDPYAITPNLDWLASQGTTFNNAYCNSPLCVPSRSSMITGEYAHRNGYWDNAHPYAGEAKGFGHILTEQGYRITTMGKLHYKGAGYDLGLPDQRFPLHVKGGTGDFYSLVREEGSAKPKLFKSAAEGHIGESDYTIYDRKITENAVRFLNEEAKADDRPWVLYLGYVCPHFPLIVPEEFYNLYENVTLPDPKQFGPSVRPIHPVLNAMRVFVGSIYAGMEEARRIVRLYYALGSFLDDQIGKVLETVRNLGMMENTRIIYSSDHGDTVGDHAMFFKHTMFEGSVGVPMIITGPGIDKGRRVNTPVSLVDIYPTILDSAGAVNEQQNKKPGCSLFRIMEEPENMERPVFSEYHGGGALAAEFMLRYGKWKYVFYPAYAPLLYDLENDPEELHNLAENPEYGSVLEMCHEKMKEVVGNPEEIDRSCRRDQMALVNANGGREKVLAVNDFVVFSPTPKE